MGDVVVLEKGFEAVVDGVAAFLAGDFHEADELLDLVIAEAGANTRRDAKGFGGEHAALDIRPWQQSLADHRFKNV